MCAHVLEQSATHARTMSKAYTKKGSGNFCSSSAPLGAMTTGFQGRYSEGGGGWGVIAAAGVLSRRWTGPTTYADRTLCVSFHFSVSSPARVHRAPEWNINHPNSIYGSQSYFLDEQCRHFCVIDDEHVGTVQCSHSNEVRAGIRALLGLCVGRPPKLSQRPGVKAMVRFSTVALARDVHNQASEFIITGQ